MNEKDLASRVSAIEKVLKEQQILFEYPKRPDLYWNEEQDKAYNAWLAAKQCGLQREDLFTVLAFLLLIERSKETGNYLEIGVLSGTTLKFLKNYTNKIKFYGIDLFEDFQHSPENTHISKTKPLKSVQETVGIDVVLIKNNSTDALKDLARQNIFFDFILIDANHTYDACRSDLEHSLTILKTGGYVAFDNASCGIFPDHKYILRDGGPWQVTQEMRHDTRFSLEHDGQRLKIFQFRGN